MKKRRTRLAHALAVLGTLLLVWARPARAWLLHEHAQTAERALELLSTPERESLRFVWAAAARTSQKLCAGSNDSRQSLYRILDSGEKCLSLPVLTGLAADHSCTPTELRKNLGEEFLLHVLKEAETVQVELRNAAGDREAHIDDWHRHHLRLQIADPDYLGRAEVNGTHFQAPRHVDEGLAAYFHRVTGLLAPPNAIALYVNYHSAALQFMSYAVDGCKLSAQMLNCAPSERRDEYFAEAIFAEAFALHFLQDAFSAGHVMSPSGSRAERMGTHDHYCETGVSVRSWLGAEHVAHGDAFLMDPDSRAVAAAVASSLRDFTAQLRSPVAPPKVIPRSAIDFNACVTPHAPDIRPGQLDRPGLRDVLEQTPRPVTDPPGLPTFQHELGLFIAPLLGVAYSVGVAGEPAAGFGDGHRLPFLAFGGLGVGLTLEGITESTNDGVIAIGANFMLDGRPPGSHSGVRLGGGFSFHMPYFAVPGDLIVLAPVALFSPDTYVSIARKAADGGWLSLQRKYSAPFGWRVQFMLGREALFALMPPPDQSDDPATERDETRAPFLSLGGKPSYVRIAVPVFSLTGFHASSEKVGLDAVWQLGYDYTHYGRSETWVGGAARGADYHGIFLAFSYRTRRYFWTP